MFKMKDYGFSSAGSSSSVNGAVKRSYNVWSHIIHRCYNPNNKGYKTYGARGVIVCEEWKLFSNFERWYNENYIEGFYIDKDMSGLNEYSPAGCRFVSIDENNKEMVSRRNDTYLIGDLHFRAKDKNEYESISSTRQNFIKICSVRGWRFDDFCEVFCEWHIFKNGKRVKKYNYKIKNIKEEK